MLLAFISIIIVVLTSGKAQENVPESTNKRGVRRSTTTHDKSKGQQQKQINQNQPADPKSNFIPEIEVNDHKLVQSKQWKRENFNQADYNSFLRSSNHDLSHHQENFRNQQKNSTKQYFSEVLAVQNFQGFLALSSLHSKASLGCLYRQGRSGTFQDLILHFSPSIFNLVPKVNLKFTNRPPTTSFMKTVKRFAQPIYLNYTLNPYQLPSPI